jgi:dsRNA-specific ribonuclease
MEYVRKPKEIYQGIRGEEFYDMLYNIFKTVLSSKYMKYLLTSEAMEIFDAAFTSQQANNENNYEFYEQIGDSAITQFIITYSYKRFPQLRNHKGVPIVARIRILYAAKNALFLLAQKLGFHPYITCTKHQHEKQVKDTMEDVFEAFVGAAVVVFDTKFKPGVGYGIVYDMLSKIFDDIDIDLSYENLTDEKTRMKELVEYMNLTESFKTQMEYKQVKEENDMKFITLTVINKRGRWETSGYGYKLVDAEMKAAKHMLPILNRHGYSKPKPQIFIDLMNV